MVVQWQRQLQGSHFAHGHSSWCASCSSIFKSRFLHKHQIGFKKTLTVLLESGIVMLHFLFCKPAIIECCLFIANTWSTLDCRRQVFSSLVSFRTAPPVGGLSCKQLIINNHVFHRVHCSIIRRRHTPKFAPKFDFMVTP